MGQPRATLGHIFNGDVSQEENSEVRTLVEETMKELIAYTRERAVANETFTGAFILKDGILISKAVTSIVPDCDPLAHAEMKALHDANKALSGDLRGCHLFTTQKPCMMCASAMLWSKVSEVTYGWDTQDSEEKDYRPEEFLQKYGVVCSGPFFEREIREIERLLPPVD